MAIAPYPVNSGLATPTLETMSEPERKALQRKLLQVLFVGQVMGSAGISVAVSVGGRFVGTVLGGSRWAGSSSAMVTLGGAVAGLVLSGIMKARGRRPGLTLGYILSLLGGLVVVLGIEMTSLWIFLFGSLFFGVGQGTNLLARYAAADLTLPTERAQAMSTLMFGSTFGAVLSLVLVERLRKLAVSWGLVDFSGPYLFAILLLVGAIINTAIRLKPDPLVVAGGVTGSAKVTVPRLGHAVRVVRQNRLATLGFVSMVVSQTAMVAVMTMTPLHMREHGHDGESSYVIALHVVGMYGLAPFVGRLSDRWGRLRTILLGASIMLAATLVSAAAGTEPPLLFLGLFLLGLGWSGSMISGTALVSDNVPANEKVGVQGSVDLIMSLCGGAAAFSSGFIKDMLAYHTLSLIGAGLAGGLFLFSLVTLRTSAVKTPART
jgi:MFS family permease